MPVLDATPGGLSSNSYVSVADASNYFLSSINKSLWATFTFKEASLIEATRMLNTYVQWKGTLIYGNNQALNWPRWWVYDLNGFLIPPDVVPQDIKNFTCELAYWIIVNNGANFDDNNLNKLEVGPIKLDFNASMRTPGMPKLVRDGINLYGRSLLPFSGEAHAVSLERV